MDYLAIALDFYYFFILFYFILFILLFIFFGGGGGGQMTDVFMYVFGAFIDHAPSLRGEE